MLKLMYKLNKQEAIAQPPSGGCVLKLYIIALGLFFGGSAAFGRLCVETALLGHRPLLVQVSRLRAAVC